MSPGQKNKQAQKKKLSKLNIKTLEHLGFLIGSSASEINKIKRNSHCLFRTCELIKNNKKRQLAVPNSRLKTLLRSLNQVLQRVELPSYMYGGIKGRSNLDNALRHDRKPLIFKADIRDFFPSIDSERIRKVYRDRLGCSDEVAEALTEMTTFEGKLPQGSPTSTVLANFAIEHLSYRLHRLAQQHGAEFTQFVDDITISGPKHLPELEALILRIIEDEGFVINPMKLCVQKENEEHVVTGVRINQGKDIPKTKLAEINQKITELSEATSAGKPISIKDIRSLEGKIRYYYRLNSGSAKSLSRKFKAVRKLLQNNLLTERKT